MTDKINLSFDIDALFEHMVDNLNHDMTVERDWSFSFRSTDLAKLQDLGERLSTEFVAGLQEAVEEVAADGSVSLGPPMLFVVQRGALSPDDVKAFAARMTELAEAEGIVYEGVNCFDAMDDEELLSWLDVEDASWQLRHFSDTGLEFDAEIPWVFLVAAEASERLEAAAQTLAAAGDDRIEIFDQLDDDGLFNLWLFADGTNNEFNLREKYEAVGAVAQQHGAELIGMQFFSEEYMRELGEEEDA